MPIINNKKNKQLLPVTTISHSSSFLSSFVKVPTDTLLIVESPAKCSTIARHLGSGYRCIATMGHLRYLDGLDSIDIKNNYHLKFKIIDSKKNQIKKIDSEIKSSMRILLATDDDREGESIAWHICELFHLPLDKTERIVFHEITKGALEYAVKHPRKINMNIVHSAHARQILDLIIGYNISPFLWKNISSSEKTLSAGRCQTPALRIIFENELERLEKMDRLNKNTANTENIKENIISNTISSYYSYSVTGYFTKFNLPFSLNTHFECHNINKVEDFLKISICENTRFTFQRVSHKPSTHVTKAPEPFTTSRLQQAASNEFAFSPSETMEMCQNLYERGYITYIRTTGKKYSADFINNQAFPFIREKWGPEYTKHEIQSDLETYCAENNTTAAHEAIRPTDITRFVLSGEYHAKEQKLYKLIWRNALESCMSDYTFLSLETAVETNILMRETGCHDDTFRFYTFSYTCHKPIFYGWKTVQGFTLEQQDQHGAMDYLLAIRNSSEISCNKIETKIVFSYSGLISHYTEARLIQSLEEKEIGRPSTFSSIIEKIKERDYVNIQNVQGESIECVEHVVSISEKKISQNMVKREFGNEKNKLCITSLGKSVCTFLISHFPHLFSYEYTKQMEANLDDIASSTSGSFDILKKVCDECSREIVENIRKYNSKNIEKNEKIIIKNDENTNQKSSSNSTSEHIVGRYGGFDTILKNGRFGKYVVWGKDGIHRKSIEKTHLQNKDFSSISLDEVVRLIENDSLDCPGASKSNSESGIIRVINDDVSIRSGKYGNYIFYKTIHMKKPKFISLKNFENNIYTCSDADFLSLLM
jgi:DNA topoisomerase-1